VDDEKMACLIDQGDQQSALNAPCKSSWHANAASIWAERRETAWSRSLLRRSGFARPRTPPGIMYAVLISHPPRCVSNATTLNGL